MKLYFQNESSYEAIFYHKLWDEGYIGDLITKLSILLREVTYEI